MGAILSAPLALPGLAMSAAASLIYALAASLWVATAGPREALLQGTRGISAVVARAALQLLLSLALSLPESVSESVSESVIESVSESVIPVSAEVKPVAALVSSEQAATDTREMGKSKLNKSTDRRFMLPS